MANARRGEIDAILGGRRVRLCLTFGALATLEQRLGVGDLSALGVRFSEARLSARDLLALITAGLEGAGDPMREEDVQALSLQDNWTALVDAAARLLATSFGQADSQQANNEQGRANTPRP